MCTTLCLVELIVLNTHADNEHPHVHLSSCPVSSRAGSMFYSIQLNGYGSPLELHFNYVGDPRCWSFRPNMLFRQPILFLPAPRLRLCRLTPHRAPLCMDILLLHAPTALLFIGNVHMILYENCNYNSVDCEGPLPKPDLLILCSDSNIIQYCLPGSGK